MKKKLLSLLFALGIFGQFLAASTLSFGAVLPQTVGVFETSLASPISTSATSMTLTANAVRGGTTLSGYNCFTVDQGSAQAEFICGTVSGTTVTILVRGIDPSTGTSTITALQFAHRRGASVKITDFPAVVIMRHQLNGSDSIYNLIKYDTNVLIGVGTPTSTLATKYYVDNTASAGAATADESTKGLAEAGTATEQASSTLSGGTGARAFLQTRYSSSSPTVGCNSTATAGALCVPVAQNDGKINTNYIGTSSAYSYNWGGQHTFNSTTTLTGTTTGGVSYLGQFMQLVSSTTINTSTGPIPVFIATSTNALVISEADVATTTDFLGFATSTNVTNGATGTVQISGIVNGFSGLTVGQPYYVSNTRGAISSTVGTAEAYVGTAVSATQILLDRKDDNWRYLGSSTCNNNAGTSVSCDTSSVPFARYAIVNSTQSGSLCSGGNPSSGVHQLIVAKNGITTATVQGAWYCSGAQNPLGGFLSTATFTSTSSIRITQTAGTGNLSSGTQTAYFYR